ncbi:MAG: type II toxin-antitoxin system HicA family toxin [Tannerellaceae bacterium]|jgi:predicted RNA binding protein YcfA (HicA-like mRNA interferase family)|nr:type II toxin-antitoxin system HicA family toxin [Tannerellaceae bacterium]
MISYIESDGLYFVTQKGSHRQFKHPIKKGRVTVPGNINDVLPPGTENSILRQAELK